MKEGGGEEGAMHDEHDVQRVGKLEALTVAFRPLQDRHVPRHHVARDPAQARPHRRIAPLTSALDSLSAPGAASKSDTLNASAMPMFMSASVFMCLTSISRARAC